MAEFVQTMKDWRRMCQTIQTKNQQFYGNCCCKLCPIQELCVIDTAVKDSTDSELFIIGDKIQAWAAENPEPVYPTWEEWLQSVGVMESSERLLRHIKDQLYIDGIPSHAVPTAKVLQPMDADIAQKLGIEPKEDV